jgi:hypothetical protein
MYTGPKFNGTGCHWGVSTTGITGYGALVITSTEHSMTSDTETARNGAGYVTAHVTYNHGQEATLETWISGSAGTGNVTISIASHPQPGDMITIVDAVNTSLSGSNWIAGNAKVSRSNTSLAKISIPLTRFALLTA